MVDLKSQYNKIKKEIDEGIQEVIDGKNAHTDHLKTV